MSASTLPEASWGELLHGRNALRSIALAGGVALHAINVYVVTTILPSMIADIGGLEYYAWNTSLFVVASIVGSALSARLLELLGPRGAYLLALCAFAAGSAWCALSPSMPSLLAARTVQGFGGGVLLALSYALIRQVFEARLWPRAMGLVSGMWGVATLCGPAVGGLFAGQGHWRWAFWSLIPVAAVLAGIVSVQLPGRSRSAGDTGMRPPYATIGLLVVSVLAVSLGSLSTSAAWNLAGVAAGCVLAVGIAAIDRRAAARLLPAGAYSLSARLGLLYALMSLLVVGITTEIFVPYFLQVIHGMTPLAAGYLTAVMAGGWTLGSVGSAGRRGAAADRMVRAGPWISLGALVAMAVLTPRAGWLEGVPGLALYCLALAGVGLGIGVGWPHLLTRLFVAAPPGEENLASASITTVQLYAMSLASALAGMVANAAGLADPGGVAGAQRAALWLFGTFAIAPALAVLLSRRVAGRQETA